jgi:hypothetical protein
LFEPAAVDACCLLFGEKGFAFSRTESAYQYQAPSPTRVAPGGDRPEA